MTKLLFIALLHGHVALVKPYGYFDDQRNCIAALPIAYSTEKAAHQLPNQHGRFYCVTSSVAVGVRK
jgi:hypothetical protein